MYLMIRIILKRNIIFVHFFQCFAKIIGLKIRVSVSGSVPRNPEPYVGFGVLGNPEPYVGFGVLGNPELYMGSVPENLGTQNLYPFPSSRTFYRCSFFGIRELTVPAISGRD